MSALPPRPLLRRSPLQPGESWPSLLTRLAVLNGYSYSLMFSVCFESEKVGRTIRRLDNDERPTLPETYERLAIITGLAPTDLAEATIQHYALPLTLARDLQYVLRRRGEGLACWPDKLIPDFRANRRAGFCPACLRESVFHRLIWTPLAMPVCLPHACLLVSRCPQCVGPLSVDMIVRTRCQACGAGLLDAPASPIGADEFGLFTHRMLYAWLEASAPPVGAWGATLPAHPPAVLYGLVRGLKLLMLERLNYATLVPAPDTNHRQRATEELPWVQYELNCLAMRAATDWPAGLQRFASRLKAGQLFEESRLARYTAEAKPLPRAELAKVVRGWRPTDFAFVHRLFTQAGLPLTKR
jgi:TniQ protein